ncbi:MAG TPA: hypothetical protein VK177_16970 [Flavobacteriales bacterium]|nr:hypothetical protein [Flavobacteriales bacterium]
MLVRFSCFIGIFAATGVYAQNSQPLVAGVKSVSEKYEWLDTWGQVIKTEKTASWTYYTNGILNAKMLYNSNNEITTAYHYVLDKDSLINYEEFYTETNKDWTKSDKFYYKKNAKNPHLSKDEKNTFGYYRYNEQGLLTQQKSVFKNGSIYELKTYAYDANGRVVNEAVYQGSNMRLFRYEYVFDPTGKLTERKVFRVPGTTENIVYDKKLFMELGGFDFTQAGELDEHTFYNEKGEVIESLSNYKKGVPMIRKLYNYEYYKATAGSF